MLNMTLYVDVNHKVSSFIILAILNAFVTIKYNGNIITNDFISLNKLPNKPYENKNVLNINKNKTNNIINNNIACILNKYISSFITEFDNKDIAKHNIH